MRLRYPYFRCGNGAAHSETLIEKAVGVNDRVPDGAASRRTSFTAGAGAHVDASPSRTRGGRFENRAYAETPELCRNLGDGVNQAADISWLATSIPSRNVTPRTILGN